MTQTQMPEPLTGEGAPQPGWARTFFGVVARPQTWLNLVYLLLAFPLGLAYFIVLVVGLSVGISLTIVVVGIPILIGLIILWRQLANLERVQARGLLGLDLPSSRLPWGDRRGFWAKIGALLADRTTWLDLFFLVVKFPLGIISFVLAVTGLAMSVGFIAAPIFQQFDVLTVGNQRIDSWPYALALVPVGILALFASLHVLNGWTWMSARMAEALLAVSPLVTTTETAPQPQAPQGWPQQWPPQQPQAPQGWPQPQGPQGWQPQQPQAPQAWQAPQQPQQPQAPQGWQAPQQPQQPPQAWPQQPQTPQGWQAPQQPQPPQAWPQQPQTPQGWPQQPVPPQQPQAPQGWPPPQPWPPQQPQAPQGWPQQWPPQQPQAPQGWPQQPAPQQPQAPQSGPVPQSAGSETHEQASTEPRAPAEPPQNPDAPEGAGEASPQPDAPEGVGEASPQPDAADPAGDASPEHSE